MFASAGVAWPARASFECLFGIAPTDLYNVHAMLLLTSRIYDSRVCLRDSEQTVCLRDCVKARILPHRSLQLRW